MTEGKINSILGAMSKMIQNVWKSPGFQKAHRPPYQATWAAEASVSTAPTAFWPPFSLSLSLSLFLPMLSGCPFRSSKTTDDISKKTGTQKVDFLGTSNFGSDMRLSPRIRWNLIRRKVLKKSTFWGPPILVLTWGCHLESDEISKNEGAQKVGFLGLQNTGPSRRCPKEI